MLRSIVHGRDTGKPPVLIAHGLFGSARNWSVIAKRLSASREVITVDMRNHGESFRAPDHNYEAMSDDLAEVIRSNASKMDVVGHSMGGKAAMMLALRFPDLVGRLVVVDIAPVAYDHSQIEYVRAMQNLDLSGVTRRSEADRRLADSVPDRALRAFFLQSLILSSSGPEWRLNLPVLADQMPLIMGFPDTDLQFKRATLFLRGEASDYVLSEYRAGISALFPGVVQETIRDAGHWPHAEVPDQFLAKLEFFLDN